MRFDNENEYLLKWFMKNFWSCEIHLYNVHRWLAVATLVTATACAGQPAPPSGGSTMSGREVLDKHLERESPGAQWVIKTICEDVPGWGFYQGRRKDRRGGRAVHWTVHAGAVVVDRPRDELLTEVYRSLAAFERPEDHPAEVLARVAVCLLHDGGGLINQRRAAAFEKKFGLRGLFAPRVTRSAGAVEIELLVHESREKLSRFRITIDERYRVSHQSEPFESSAAP